MTSWLTLSTCTPQRPSEVQSEMLQGLVREPSTRLERGWSATSVSLASVTSDEALPSLGLSSPSVRQEHFLLRYVSGTEDILGPTPSPTSSFQQSISSVSTDGCGGGGKRRHRVGQGCERVYLCYQSAHCLLRTRPSRG